MLEWMLPLPVVLLVVVLVAAASAWLLVWRHRRWEQEREAERQRLDQPSGGHAPEEYVRAELVSFPRPVPDTPPPDDGLGYGYSRAHGDFYEAEDD